MEDNLYYKINKNIFIQLKKFIDGRCLWRKVGSDYIISTPSKYLEKHLTPFKITYEESLHY